MADPPHSAAAEEASRWPIVWLACGAGIGKLPPALPEIRVALDAGLVMGGWIASLISLTGFALGLIAGSVADRFGQRRVLLFGLGALTAGSLIGAVAPTGEVMLAARLVESIGFTAVTITGGAIVVRVTARRDRRMALGIWSSYIPVGFAGMLIAGAAIHDAIGWRALWIVCAALTLIWAAVFARATAGWQRRQAGEIVPEALLRNIRRTVGSRGAVLVAGCFALYAAQHISLMNWLPTYMREVHGSGALAAASLPALVLLFNAGGNYLAAWGMGRGVPAWVLLAAGAAGMAATEIGIFSGALPESLRLLSAVLFGVAGGLVPAAALGSVATYTPSPAQIGTMNGLMVMGTNAGQLFGPPALAAAREAAGSWEGALWLVLALALAGVLTALAARRFERRAAAPANTLD